MPRSGSGWAIKFSEDVGGHVIFNNILIGSTGSLAVGSTLTSNANVLGGNLSDDSENTTISLSIWRGRNGQDAASTTSTKTASFRNASGGDYKTSTTSPAKDSALASLGSVDAPTRSTDGSARPAGNRVDDGAFRS